MFFRGSQTRRSFAFFSFENDTVIGAFPWDSALLPHTRAVIATDEGRLYADAFRNILRQLDDTKTLIGERRQDPGGEYPSLNTRAVIYFFLDKFGTPPYWKYTPV